MKIKNCSKKEIKRQAFDIVSKLDREKQCNYEEFFMKKVAKKNKEPFLNFYYNVAEQLEIENTERDSNHSDETGN